MPSSHGAGPKKELPSDAIPVQILVSTNIGSEFLDKKKKLSIPPTATVRHLKKLIKAKFPGSPPISLQRLACDTTILDDSVVVSEATSNGETPVVLETISGSGSYNRSLSVAQSIDAYVATIVQSAFIGNKLQQLGGGKPAASLSDEIETLRYRDMLQAARENLETSYAVDIDAAKEAERSPEVSSAYSWRVQKPSLSPLWKSLARELDLNTQSFFNMVYYSFLMVLFGMLGTVSKSATQLVLSLIPSIWLSKIRGIRIFLKIAGYFVLQLIRGRDFVLPLFPVTLQVCFQRLDVMT